MHSVRRKGAGRPRPHLSPDFNYVTIIRHIIRERGHGIGVYLLTVIHWPFRTSFRSIQRAPQAERGTRAAEQEEYVTWDPPVVV